MNTTNFTQLLSLNFLLGLDYLKLSDLSVELKNAFIAKAYVKLNPDQNNVDSELTNLRNNYLLVNKLIQNTIYN
jgi:hypothetical protein